MRVLYVAGEGGHSAHLVAVLEMGMFPADEVHVALSRLDEAEWFEFCKPCGVHFLPKPNPLGLFVLRQAPRWARAFRDSVRLMLSLRPDLVVCGGSNAVIAPSIVAKALGARVVVTECFVQVTQPSRTCRFLDSLGISDEVLVEWDFQERWFRRSRMVGMLVPRRGSSGLKNGDATYPSVKLMKAMQEGIRVMAVVIPQHPDRLRATHQAFIDYIRYLGWIDDEGWTIKKEPWLNWP